ncbi:MAG: hypothetical protein ACF8QF_10155, partial [Phycisphaerales bacterium]
MASALHDILLRTLRRLRRGRRIERIATGAMILALGALSIGAVDAWLRPGPDGRRVLGACAVALVFLGLMTLRLDRRTRRAGRLRAASSLERAAGIEPGAIVGAAQLSGDDCATGVARALVERAATRAATIAGEAAARPLPRRRREHTLGASALVAVAGVVCVGVVAPRFFAAVSARLLDPGARLPAWSLEQVTLSAPESKAPIGDDVIIEATTTGAADAVRLELLASNRVGAPVLDAMPMASADDGRFRATLRNLREPVWLVAVAGNAESAPILVAPVPRPRIERATVEQIGATETRVEALQPGEVIQLEAEVGDAITLHAAASIDLGGAETAGADESSVTGNLASAAFRATEPGEFALSLRPVGPTGLAAPQAASVTVRVREREGHQDPGDAIASATDEGGDAGGAQPGAPAAPG